MKLLYGNRALRWLPSRHHFALFRLAAYVRLRSGRFDDPPERIWAIDRHQSTYETYAAGLWIIATLACFYTALMPRVVLPVAFVIGLALGNLTTQALTLVAGAVVPIIRLAIRRPGENNLHANSVAVMLMLAGIASWFAMHRSWVRFAAWQFLGLIALNALAWVILLLLREKVARLEEIVGGQASAPQSLSSR